MDADSGGDWRARTSRPKQNSRALDGAPAPAPPRGTSSSVVTSERSSEMASGSEVGPVALPEAGFCGGFP